MAMERPDIAATQAAAMENFMALQLAFFELFSDLQDESRAIELAAEVELRAGHLIAHAQLAPHDVHRKPNLSLVPEAKPAPVSTAARVRDACMTMQGAFTLRELASVLDMTPSNVGGYLKPMVLDGKVKDTGSRFRGQTVFEWVKQDNPATPGRVDKCPPEKDPPSYDLAPVRGMPVRIAKGDRKARSTSGTAKPLKDRDREWKKLQEAREAQAEASRRARIAREQAAGPRRPAKKKK